MRRVKLEGGGEEQRQSLLSGDAAVEEREGLVGVDAVAGQRLG